MVARCWTRPCLILISSSGKREQLCASDMDVECQDSDDARGCLNSTGREKNTAADQGSPCLTGNSAASNTAEIKSLLDSAAPHLLCFQSSYKVGNCTVLCPALYERAGLGIIGPDWMGPPCTLSIILLGSAYYIYRAAPLGITSQAVCFGLALFSAVALFFVACGDPGLLTRSDRLREVSPGLNDGSSVERQDDSSGIRWCDVCSVYQNENSHHCRECNLCIDGHDHHCAWMGTCVGQKNFKAFVAFNISWLVLLAYAIGWITILGPIAMGFEPGE